MDDSNADRVLDYIDARYRAMEAQVGTVQVTLEGIHHSLNSLGDDVVEVRSVLDQIRSSLPSMFTCCYSTPQTKTKKYQR